MWHPSSECRRRGVDVCALWGSPNISTLENVPYIPTGDYSAFEVTQRPGFP